MPCPFSWLVITDGTTNDAGIRNQVDLLSVTGFCLLEEGDWRPAISEPKGGGVWKDSQLADGRRPADFKAANVTESMMLTVSALDQDQLIRDTQELRRLLTKARTYGTTDWQTVPVWIEAKSPGETNMRYAIVWDWRTPNDGNPYEEPFWQVVARSGMDDFVLVLEREPYWRADEPGETTCIETASYGTYCWPCHIDFNGVSTDIAIPDNAFIQDLHAAAMTVEAWIRIDTLGTGNQIIHKGTSGFNGWWFWLDATDGLRAKIECATLDGESRSGLDDISADGEWHHVAFTWDNATYNYPRLWIDGEEPSYAFTQNRNGVINSDVGIGMHIGSINAGIYWFDGDMTWLRISTLVRYAAPFTPPARCVLPDIDINTIAQYMGLECSGTAILNQKLIGGFDGTLANGTFDCDCTHDYGNITPTCQDEIYWANKRNDANLTDVYHFDASAGVYSANLLGAALPYDLLPAVPANNDILYFGINSLQLNSGPFCSLVLNLATASVYAGVATATWQYWDSVGGAWAALTVQDNTDNNGIMSGDPLDTTGVRSVHWIQPGGVGAPWGPTLINGVTAYWVRLLYSIPAPPGDAVSVPVQQTYLPYTITWPYFEVDGEDIAGDVTALLTSFLHNQSADGINAYYNRIIMGLRSTSRGSLFTAYINLSDEQNPTGANGFLIGAADLSTFQTDVQTPTGRYIRYQLGAAQALTTEATVVIRTGMEPHYRGKFRWLLRVQQIGGVAGDMSVRGGIRLSTQVYNTWTKYTQRVAGWETIDLGLITLPPTPVLATEGTNTVTLLVDVGCSNAGGGELRMYDIILIPVDEWAIDTSDMFESGDATWDAIDYTSALRVDSAIFPKRNMRSQVVATGEHTRVWETYKAITAGPSILQANETQRIWIFAEQVLAAAWPRYPTFEICGSVQAEAIQRYYSMRGSR